MGPRMASSDKFCLRWNDFESNISVAFREIREEKDFFDCTLSCGSRQIQAHKLILSACSPFFRSVLRQVGLEEQTRMQKVVLLITTAMCLLDIMILGSRFLAVNCVGKVSRSVLM